MLPLNYPSEAVPGSGATSTHSADREGGDLRSLRSTSILSSVLALLDSNKSCFAPSSSSESVLSSLSVLPELRRNVQNITTAHRPPAKSRVQKTSHTKTLCCASPGSHVPVTVRTRPTRAPAATSGAVLADCWETFQLPGVEVPPGGESPHFPHDQRC